MELLTESTSWAVLGAAARSEILLEFVKHDVFRQICAKTIGADVDLYFDSIAFKASGRSKELGWHQESAYGRTDRPYIACWTALTRAVRGSGCLWVAPGSHRKGPREHKRHSESEAVYAGPVVLAAPEQSIPLELEPGQVAVLHSELLHRSEPNTSGADRLGYLCGYVSAATRFLDAGVAGDLKLPLFRDGKSGAA